MLNRLQADYSKENKLHLSEMHCLELVEENEKLNQLRHEICEKIRNLFMERYKGKKWEDTIYIAEVCNITNSVIDQIEKGEE